MTTCDSSLFSPADFQLLFESAPGCYLILTPDFTIAAASDAYLQATMTLREAIVGRGLFEVFPDNPLETSATGSRNLRASLERVLHGRVPDVMTVQKYDIQRPAHVGGGFEERHWRPVNYPVCGADKQIRFLLHRVEDVTELVQLKQRQSNADNVKEGWRARAEQGEAEAFLRAEELREINRQLRAANEERAQLYERLQRLDFLKTQFVNNVSQELRVPLKLITVPSEALLESGNLSPEQRDDVLVIARNARRLRRQIDELLDIAHLDVSTMAAHYVDVDVAALVRRTADSFVPLAQEYGFLYDVDIPGSLAARVDSAKVEHVVVNLLANAFGFTPPGGKVTCALRARGAHAMLTVTDNGPGIPVALRTAVFERFFSTMTRTTQSLGGPGLGLSIAKDFVTLHGGTLTIDDRPGGGTHVTVELPLHGGAGPADGWTPPSLPAISDVAHAALERLRMQLPSTQGNAQTPAQARKLVLVVEDNPEMSRYLCAILSQDYRTEAAFDGEEALQKAIRLRPDLVLSDVTMPRMSGPQLVQELRARPELATTPIVMLTGKTDEALRVRLLREGVQDYLVKPFSKEELRVRVVNLIERRRAEAALLQANQEAAAMNEELEAFSYSVAHDLRAPLRGINGFSQALLEDYAPHLDANACGYLDRIRRATQRMGQLIDALLSLSQVTRAELHREWVNLAELAAAVIERLRNDQPERNVTFVNQEGPRVLGDPRLLGVLLENLLGNAWKFTGHQTQGHIELGWAYRDRAFTYHVRDNGAGFDMAHAEKLFAPFQRLHAATTFAGTGVGLATVQRIVHRHGGRVWAEGAVGQGATFSFTLNVTTGANA